MGERVVKVWAWITAAHEGDAPVSIAALCRAAVLRLEVDGASVTAVSGPVAREPVCASDEVSARLEEFQFIMGEGLAERHHMTPDQAFLIVRRYARDHNRPLTALAGDVIHGTADISPGSQATARPAPHGEPENPPGPGAATGPHS